jgi:hypothetical protein
VTTADPHDGRPWLRGLVADAGGIERGVGFTIIKTGRGTYTVGFVEPYADIPVVVVTPAVPGTVASAAPSAVGADVSLRDHDGQAVDAAFGFLVAPVY